jgi:sec-independent protein translocase protein TatA
MVRDDDIEAKRHPMGSFGPPEFLIILLILVLLFGAKKLPELARGSGRALRIFKSETKGLVDDEDKDEEQQARPQLSQSQPPAGQAPPPAPTTETQHTETDR